MNNSLDIAQLLGSQDEFYRKFRKGTMNQLRVAMPGIIQSFDPTEQTVTVQPALRETIIKPDQTREIVNMPLLLDVPIVLPRSGGYCLTFPIKQGDECLIVFADMCIDAWWSYAGVQNQLEKRRHDLSDAFAILGPWSQPNVLPNYSMDSVQLRNQEGTSYIELRDDNVNLVGNVKLNGVTGTTINDYDNLNNRVDEVRDEKVDKIEGKGLSTNDFNNDYKNKIDQIINSPNNYVHNQLVPSNEWIIEHNLNKYPSVTVVDSGGNAVIGDINYKSMNEIVISFQSAFSGNAYLN